MMRKYGKGFTVVEIIVTIVVLIILTTIVVARLSLTQVGGRDQEREFDITTIATGLEVYYNDGDSTGTIPKGYYPGTSQVQQALIASPPFQTFLEGVPSISFEAPGRTITDSFGTSATNGTNADGSYTDAQARGLFSNYPYLYQPIRRNNAYCLSYIDCVKFNLYYLNERTDTVIKIRSKNQ